MEDKETKRNQICIWMENFGIFLPSFEKIRSPLLLKLVYSLFYLRNKISTHVLSR